MEPARGIGPRLPPYHGDVLPLSLSRRELGAQVSNLETSRSKRDGSANSPTAHQSRLPASNGLPRRYKLRALPDELRRHRVPGATRTHTVSDLNAVPLPFLGYEDVEPSSGADPDRLPYGGKVTAVCDGQAGEPGLEPGTSWARTKRAARLRHSPSVRKVRFERTYREV